MKKFQTFTNSYLSLTLYMKFKIVLDKVILSLVVYEIKMIKNELKRMWVSYK